jgi:hypothetical protein
VSRKRRYHGGNGKRRSRRGPETSPQQRHAPPSARRTVDARSGGGSTNVGTAAQPMADHLRRDGADLNIHIRPRRARNQRTDLDLAPPAKSIAQTVADPPTLRRP